MTTQEPVPGLDELRLAYDMAREDEFFGHDDNGKEVEAAFAALITAIEAPWREALENIDDVWEDVTGECTADCECVIHPARALLNRGQEAEVNDAD